VGVEEGGIFPGNRRHNGSCRGVEKGEGNVVEEVLRWVDKTVDQRMVFVVRRDVVAGRSFRTVLGALEGFVEGAARHDMVGVPSAGTRSTFHGLDRIVETCPGTQYDGDSPF
jgi:hypothetical protein